MRGVPDYELSPTCEVCECFHTGPGEGNREHMRKHMREEHTLEEIIDAATLEEL